MALLQISEPGMSTAPHQHRLAAGIDLGTTNSLVASVRSGTATTLPDGEGEHLLPSIVNYSDHEPVVGKQARALLMQDPLNTVVSVKRLVGRSAADLDAVKRFVPYHFVQEEGSNVPRIETTHRAVTPIEVSAEILSTLKQRAEQTLGDELAGVVITVPAYFDDAQRQATKDAAKLAELNVYRLLNEPTAAAVAYGLDRGSEGIIAVYDLGGGTFDVSILRLNKGVFEVLATGGDSALGGDDFDHAIADWILQQLNLPQLDDHVFTRQVLEAARLAKVALSDAETTTLQLQLPDGTAWQAELSREQFEGMLEPLVKKTILSARRALRDAGVDREDVIEVVMVGGSTRVPLVRQKVGEFFGKPPLVDIDPDRVVAIGAAIQADVLAGNKPEEELLLLDVIPLSLGLETMGGLVEKVLQRNTTIPVARAQEFTTYKDGQTAMAVHILQGERELVTDNRSLAKFELRGIPPMVAGAARIKVTFQVDADGLLSVTAEETNSGVKAGVEVKPSYGLRDDEVESMLRDSMNYAQDDLETRRLREEQVEADRVIEALDAALAKDGEALLSAAELGAIQAARTSLFAARYGDNHAAIRTAIKQLEKDSEAYVARRMNESVKSAMAGHNVEEFDQDNES